MPILDRWQTLTAVLAIPTVLMMQAGRTIPPSDATLKNERLLTEIQRLSEAHRSFSSQTDSHRRNSQDALAVIENLARLRHHRDLRDLTLALNAGDPTCAEPGSLLLSTNQTLLNEGSGSVTFVLEGIAGSQQFTFASGTSQTNMMLAFNVFQVETGIEASISEVNENLIEIRSIERTADAFVRVSQLAGAWPLIYTALDDDTASFEEIDFALAERLGDLDCNGAVTVIDLLQLIQAWGPCGSCVEDLDDSGTVNVLDLLLLLSNWN